MPAICFGNNLTFYIQNHSPRDPKKSKASLLVANMMRPILQQEKLDMIITSFKGDDKCLVRTTGIRRKDKMKQIAVLQKLSEFLSNEPNLPIKGVVDYLNFLFQELCNRSTAFGKNETICINLNHQYAPQKPDNSGSTKKQTKKSKEDESQEKEWDPEKEHKGKLPGDDWAQGPNYDPNDPDNKPWQPKE